MKRIPLQRKVALRRVGKRGREWEQARAKLKIAFERAGITRCELRYAGCWRDNALGFCHSKKRRNIQGDELYECCLGCNPCHDELESQGEVIMTAIVREAIRRRPVPVILDADRS